MADKLEALETWAAGLLEQLQPAARNQVARSIGQELRRSQQKRVQTQINPDGSKFAPRKKRDLRGKQGRIQRKVEMFKKLRTATYMKARGSTQARTLFPYTTLLNLHRRRHSFPTPLSQASQLPHLKSYRLQLW
ncbi:phage virion morphogenesis protein [Pseudomonas tolaasii]|uniref:phage virion morphogenesis protein n=1 Tax=Pseudomonas tolaasii TaxID=29442 RepID=UPI0009B62777|nr:phage virion morphogenesis protein [Pseudomonas tolaasii]ARB30215.1 phage virion morphogenesis protein [Pseudomonas tolaasii]